MRMPSPPKFCPHQRYAGRFWDTSDVMELLSMYYGATTQVYPKTWQYRTLIAIHRANDISNAYRKGYGPDWKCLTKNEVDGKVQWIKVKNSGFAIKDDLLEYLGQGRVPFQALQIAAAEIRKVEFATWVTARVERNAPGQKTALQAAE